MTGHRSHIQITVYPVHLSLSVHVGGILIPPANQSSKEMPQTCSYCTAHQARYRIGAAAGHTAVPIHEPVIPHPRRQAALATMSTNLTLNSSVVLQ